MAYLNSGRVIVIAFPSDAVPTESHDDFANYVRAEVKNNQSLSSIAVTAYPVRYNEFAGVQCADASQAEIAAEIYAESLATYTAALEAPAE